MGCTGSSGGAAGALLASAGSNCGILDKYELGETIGEGARAQVLLATARSQSERRAVKVMSVRAQTAADQARNEVEMWQATAPHANVVSLHEVFFEGCTCYMVMELGTCSVMDDLFRLMEAGELACGAVVRGMLLGLAHCASVGVVHRDVKPENFLLCSEEGGARTSVKLADFGSAVALPPGELLHGEAGTPPYMSPQMVGQAGYDHGTDVWSVGVVTYVMFFRNFPYGQGESTRHAMLKAIRAGKPPRFRSESWESARKPSLDGMAFVRRLLDADARTRPTALDALELPFMTRCDADAESFDVHDEMRSRHLERISLECARDAESSSQNTCLSVRATISVGAAAPISTLPTKQAHSFVSLPFSGGFSDFRSESQGDASVGLGRELCETGFSPPMDTKRSL